MVNLQPFQSTPLPLACTKLLPVDLLNNLEVESGKIYSTLFKNNFFRTNEICRCLFLFKKAAAVHFKLLKSFKNNYSHVQPYSPSLVYASVTQAILNYSSIFAL